MRDLEHLCPMVDSKKSEYAHTLTHTSVNTSVRNSVWKKNYINMIWSSLSFGASPSGAVVIIISTLSSRRDSGAPLGAATSQAPWTPVHARPLLPSSSTLASLPVLALHSLVAPRTSWPTGAGGERTQRVHP